MDMCIDLFQCNSQEQQTQKAKVDIDIVSLRSRIEILDAIERGTKYAKQKGQLQTKLEDFLESLVPKKTLQNCTIDDIRLFLVWKDGQGRTRVHKIDCQFRGSKEKSQCECPSQQAAGTVDSLIGNIRAILRDIGRGTEWNQMYGCGNPAAAPQVKMHLHAVRKQQAEANVLPKQAQPLLFDKVIKMSRFLAYQLKAKSLDPTSRYLLLRDRVYFILICQLGDRAGDLGLVQTSQIQVSEGQVVVQETLGKCLPSRKKSSKRVVLLKVDEALLCPVRATQEYVEEAKNCGVDLQLGYFFRMLDMKIRPQQVVNKPVTSGAMSARLKTHLSQMGLWEGETSHSARVGCSITLALLGVPVEDIQAHIGWESKDMVDHYTRGATTSRQRRVASTLAAAVGRDPSGTSRAETVAKEFRDALAK